MFMKNTLGEWIAHRFGNERPNILNAYKNTNSRYIHVLTIEMILFINYPNLLQCSYISLLSFTTYLKYHEKKYTVTSENNPG